MPTRTITEDALFEAINMWASDFRTALMDGRSYPSSHYTFQEDARILKRQLQEFLFSDTTIFDYVGPIFLDSVTRGYVHSIHFPALYQAFKQWASDDNVPAWKPPADIPIPGLPPIHRPHTKGRAIRFIEGTVQEEEEEGQPVVVKASAGKGKEQ